MFNVCLELATVGDLKLCERPQSYTLMPGESKHVKANIKVSQHQSVSRDFHVVFRFDRLSVSAVTGSPSSAFPGLISSPPLDTVVARAPHCGACLSHVLFIRSTLQKQALSLVPSYMTTRRNPQAATELPQWRIPGMQWCSMTSTST